MVIMDDTELDLGRIQLKKGGGTTQRGIEDVAARIRTPQFLRVRFGVSRPPGHMDRADFVLKQFPRNEQAKVKAAIETVCNAAKMWMEKGEVHAMNAFNKR